MALALKSSLCTGARWLYLETPDLHMCDFASLFHISQGVVLVHSGLRGSLCLILALIVDATPEVRGSSSS
jgi:hypothetical protein